MSLNTLNDHHLYSSYLYTPKPPCCFYYSDSTSTFSWPITTGDSSTLSNNNIPLRDTGNTRLHRKHRQYRLNTATEQSIDSDDKMFHSFDDLKKLDGYQSISLTRTEHVQPIKQQLQRRGSVVLQHVTLIDDAQYTDLIGSFINHSRALRDQCWTISKEVLISLLDKLTSILKRFEHIEQQQQYLSLIIDVINALTCVRSSVLISVAQHEFFTILQTIFIHLIRQWHRFSPMQGTEFLVFRKITVLIQQFIKATDDLTLIPSWFTNSTLLEAIATALVNMVNVENILKNKNRTLFKHFIHLIDAYLLYQQLINQYNNAQADALLILLDSIVHSLTSSHFINTLSSLPVDARSMSTIEKFFLIKCPAFLTAYNGSRLEQTMDSLLSTRISQYAQLIGKLIISVRNWKRSMIRAIDHLLQLINHGARQSITNAKHVSGQLSLIDNVLKLVNEPMLYNNLHETLSNPETGLMNTMISFLVNMISDALILAHIKKAQVTKIFLRLTKCTYEPLVFNVYTLLAYITHEEDIKGLSNPGRLLTIAIQSLDKAIAENNDKTTRIEQLLETLKHLVQHDQIKDEIIKQNAVPFLLECTKKLVKRPLALLIEILWSLTFVEEIAQALRANADFLSRIQTISQDNLNEALKKAADGLVWKLIQEPASLEKVAKQEEEQEAHVDEKSIITQNLTVVGKEKTLKISDGISEASSERFFRYDIMISYCHSDKELTYKIHKFLIDQGFKVWIDLDNMYGPAMSAMAEAVENSEFVLMCMSDAYKQSTYCQAEAEYAFKCKRRLIPVIMRPGYRPDGWLGLMIGSRVYMDFGRFDFETACEKLLTEISLQRNPVLSSITLDPLEHQKPYKNALRSSQNIVQDRKRINLPAIGKLPVKKDLFSSIIKARQANLDFMRKPVDQWSETDVLDFLLANRLNQLMSLCEAMDGQAFIQLYKICTSRRLRAFSVLKEELKLRNNTNLTLSIYSRFLSLTEKALNFSPTADASPSSPPPLTIPPNDFVPFVPPAVTRHIPFLPAPHLNRSFDFSIESDASAFDTLQMVQSYSSQLQYLDSLRRQVGNVSK